MIPIIVTAELNRTVVTHPPIAIFHDEVPEVINPPSPVCRSAGARWHFPNGNSVSTMAGGEFRQLVTPTAAALVRLVDASEITNHTFSGLWSCCDESGAIPLGIYSRGGGE